MRSLSGQLASTLRDHGGVAHVAEMAVGQLWRVTLDSWGIAGIGLVAAVAVAVRGRPRGPSLLAVPSPGVRTNLRIMAGLSVAVTVAIAFSAPAALPADQSPAWASARYLDGMIVVFFLAGAAVLLRAGPRSMLSCAACAAGLTVLTAVMVASYAGAALPTSGFAAGFNFAGPAVLTQDWTQASVRLATAVALGLLAFWVAFALALRRRRPAAACWGRLALGACVATVSLVALAQVTSNVSRAGTAGARAADVPASALRPGQQVAVASGVAWQVSVPEAFEVSWTELQFFNPASQPPPAGVTAVEMPWPAGQPARASWPHAPAGWRVAASSQAGGWVLWQKS